MMLARQSGRACLIVVSNTASDIQSHSYFMRHPSNLPFEFADFEHAVAVPSHATRSRGLGLRPMIKHFDFLNGGKPHEKARYGRHVRRAHVNHGGG